MSKRTRWILIGAVALIVVVVLVIVLVTLNQRPKSVDRPTPVGSSDTPSPAASPTPSASPTASTPPLAADALVVVRATATDTSGAQLALTMVVHQPVGKDNPSVASDLAQFVSQCRTDPNWATEAEASSGIEHVDVTAVPIGASAWPASSEISVIASNNNILLRSGSGLTPSVHYVSDPPRHPCELISGIYGPANGTATVLMWARPGFGMPVQSPNVYRWENWEYGFFAADGPAGPVAISNCTVTVTDAGHAFGWDPAIWHESNDGFSCEGSGADFDT